MRQVLGRKSGPAEGRLPAFSLYGEPGAPAAELLHIEPIQSRSKRYDWEIDAHVHQGLHQVIWLRSGPVEAMLDETRSAAKGPAVIAIPPGVAHAFRFSPASDGHVLTLNAALLAEGDADEAGAALQALFAAPCTLSLDGASPDAVRLQHLFEALQAEADAADSSASPVPRWLARSVVWRLAQLMRHDQAATAQRRGVARRSVYTRWVVLMEAHYRDHWPVSRYAERLGLSTERLNRMVRTETGHNAQALLHARLAREACRRLVHVAAPVSRLGYELGFDDPAYFCRFFKRHTGLGPRDYRARALQATRGDAAAPQAR
ncbi:MAG: helix-turn-helix domain-containing protein [Ideonella sp.]|nr:helix-turn-helix domain-containing protein [Ideonella sp.]